jgi:hypothetical protein
MIMLSVAVQEQGNATWNFSSDGRDARSYFGFAAVIKFR